MKSLSLREKSFILLFVMLCCKSHSTAILFIIWMILYVLAWHGCRQNICMTATQTNMENSELDTEWGNSAKTKWGACTLLIMPQTSPLLLSPYLFLFAPTIQTIVMLLYVWFDHFHIWDLYSFCLLLRLKTVSDLSFYISFIKMTFLYFGT